jgi:hypothetical protein
MSRVSQDPYSHFTVSFETPTTWTTRFPNAYPPGICRPSYTPTPFPRALDLLFVAFYDSQGYGGGILTCLHTDKQQGNNQVAFSLQTNCTDPAADDCRRSRPLSFPVRSRYFFILVAPQLSTRGWVDSVPDPLFVIKSGGASNRARYLWICSQKVCPLDNRGDPLHTNTFY